MSLNFWKRKKLKEFNICNFYYLCPVKNIENILKYGILSKNKISELMDETYSFADNNVQEIRDQKNIICSDRQSYNLHDLVPLYFTPKTPVLYKLRDNQKDLMFIVVNSEIICDQNIFYAFSDGNAACHNTKFYWSLNNLSKLSWDVIKSESWNEYEDGKRKRCSEFLIYPKVGVNRITKFVLYNDYYFKFICNILKKYNIYRKVQIDNKGEYFFDKENLDFTDIF